MATPKIIVFGSLNGQFESALTKLTMLHAKNDFTVAILAGDAFTPQTKPGTISSLLNGTLKVPLPTYFTVGGHPLPEKIAAKAQSDEEICPNLYFLGKRSVTKTSEGIRIAVLGGLFDASIVGGTSQEQHLPLHTEDYAKALRSAHHTDLLLTSMWPAHVWTGSKVALESSQLASIQSTKAIAELCAALKPRYHLSASPGDFFYEREPFLQNSAIDSNASSVTRFISLAPYANQAKAKSIYAFSLNRLDAELPPGITTSPFAAPPKKRAINNEPFSRFGRIHDDDSYHSRGIKRRRASPPPGPDRCYFCLSNPNTSVHMCCSIGDDSYITTAKGPLPTPATFAEQGINFPCHLIIIPLAHAPTTPSLGSATDPTSDAVRTHREMNRFREALQAMIATKSSNKLGAVAWEISRERNVHFIWQLIALPADMIQQGIVEAAFRVEAENQRYPTLQTRDVSLEQEAGYGDFFRVWLWAKGGEDETKSKSLVMPLPRDLRFDLQFGRRVLAKLLGLESRFLWQDCVQSTQDETSDAGIFRDAFKDWDFTLS